MRFNKILSLIIMFFVFAGKLVLAGEEKPKLRWEYKYQEGEVLYYKEHKKYNRPLVEVMGRKLGGDKFEGELIFMLDIGEKDKDERTKIHSGSFDYYNKINNPIFYEGASICWMTMDGNVKEMNFQPIFPMSQPQFLESGLDIWSKEIKLFPKEMAEIIGHYRVLEHENILKGRKCVVIETEIGQVEDGTDAEKGIYDVFGPGRGRIKIKAKTWFDPEAGKIIKMETHKETGLRGQIQEDVVYELLDESQIKKLDGIEDDWEMVLPGVNNFQLTSDNKIVYVKEAPLELADSTKSNPTSNGVKTTSNIWICDGDGGNQRRLTEGTNPVVSPDGKWVAVNDKDGKLKVVDKGTGEENTELLKNIDNVSVHGGSWAYSYSFLKEKLPTGLKFSQGWWSDGHKKVIFRDSIISNLGFPTVGNNFYMYDIGKGKLIDLPELTAMHSSPNYSPLSPRDLIFIIGGKLLYLSDDGKIIKNENAISSSYYWTIDGYYLVYYSENKDGTKTTIYSIKAEKVIGETPRYSIYDRFKFSSDYKYIYFRRGGSLTGRQDIYRIFNPKELYEQMVRGNK